MFYLQVSDTFPNPWRNEHLCLRILRIRRVKCDETKPNCNKCVSTGRKCDGYESPFRPFVTEPLGRNMGQQGVMEQVEFLPAEVEIFSRLFSTKTMFDVKLGCEEESKQVLRASLTQAPLRSAIASLKLLRQDLESSFSSLPSFPWRPEGSRQGLQHYIQAMTGLAETLSLPDRTRVPSTLLCCETFISIEQVRGDYGAMVQHILRGLEIMHEYGARPCLTREGRLAPAYSGPLPLIDVFVLKLFLAPCLFKEKPTPVGEDGERLLSLDAGTADTCHHQPLDTKKRKQLGSLATETLVFLNDVRHLKSIQEAVQLLPKKAHLLQSLDEWLFDLNRLQTHPGSTEKEPLAVLFMRVFQQLLRIFLLYALSSSSDLNSPVAIEKGQLLKLAGMVSTRVQAYNAVWRGVENG
ncbi:hypothetical protein PRZ48_009049 [Zasmidium cellare]|uniref:Zn(2)-C6 fungal-type domain-containing protein n=1 Tax=Zasmidium cellare TaxID=395010 RepID=A0ABR0EH79_ZASCE|nr:hypothetical protein PRZ48_009049 [Zasmidium cellare]